MITNEQKAALFKEKLIQNEILVASGYTFTEEAWKLFGTELHGPDEEPYYNIKLSNRSNRLFSMSIHFNSSVFITGFLENTLEKDSFMLTDWMLYHDKWRDQQSMFNLGTYPEDFAVAVTVFFENLNRLLEYPDLRMMLEGKDWKEIHFDWGNMK